MCSRELTSIFIAFFILVKYEIVMFCYSTDMPCEFGLSYWLCIQMFGGVIAGFLTVTSMDCADKTYILSL